MAIDSGYIETALSQSAKLPPSKLKGRIAKNERALTTLLSFNSPGCMRDEVRTLLAIDKAVLKLKERGATLQPHRSPQPADVETVRELVDLLRQWLGNDLGSIKDCQCLRCRTSVSLDRIAGKLG